VGIVPDETSTRQIIRIYEPIFDKLFFLGSLQGKLSITATGDPATRGDEKIHGMAFPATDGADIELNIHGEGGRQRILQHVATLLHEMIHAFFMVYMLPKYYREKTFRKYGYDGNGQYWHEIAYALEKAVNGLGGVQLDLGRSRAIWREMAKGERIDPRKWGMNVQRNQAAPPHVLVAYQTRILQDRKLAVAWPPGQ